MMGFLGIAAVIVGFLLLGLLVIFLKAYADAWKH